MRRYNTPHIIPNLALPNNVHYKEGFCAVRLAILAAITCVYMEHRCRDLTATRTHNLSPALYYHY